MWVIVDGVFDVVVVRGGCCATVGAPVAILVVDLEVIIPGVIFVVVVAVVTFAISWNATNTLYELFDLFVCLILVLVLVERQFKATVLNVEAEVIVGSWLLLLLRSRLLGVQQTLCMNCLGELSVTFWS